MDRYIETDTKRLGIIWGCTHADEAAPTTARNLELQRLFWIQPRDVGGGGAGDSVGRSSL